MRQAICVWAAALCVATVSPLLWAQARDDRPPRMPTLTVNGSGEVFVRPDRAVVRLGAVAQAPEAGAAQEKVNQAMQQVIEKVKGLGIPASAIQTAELRLQPVYVGEGRRPQMEEPAEPRIAAYRAFNVVQVQIDKLEQVGDVIDAAMGAGANQLQGLTFERKDDLPQRQEAIKKAVDEARAKAQALADAAGMRLEGVQEIQEGGVSIIRPQFEQFRAMAAAATPVEAGQVQVQASVTITYRIGGAGAAAPPAAD